eukprot:TRINITY_DN2680_c0_g1_i5.p1 TRINITY_DN2680_c0_g1~~TRINITY_DN2680_c0_g1_i5.p1  ORF type:complete len:249 (-),score=53.90 TRINITY_DN2680_c0_g1_i5:392-1138(-)
MDPSQNNSNHAATDGFGPRRVPRSIAGTATVQTSATSQTSAVHNDSATTHTGSRRNSRGARNRSRTSANSSKSTSNNNSKSSSVTASSVSSNSATASAHVVSAVSPAVVEAPRINVCGPIIDPEILASRKKSRSLKRARQLERKNNKPVVKPSDTSSPRPIQESETIAAQFDPKQPHKLIWYAMPGPAVTRYLPALVTSAGAATVTSRLVEVPAGTPSINLFDPADDFDLPPNSVRVKVILIAGLFVV